MKNDGDGIGETTNKIGGGGKSEIYVNVFKDEHVHKYT
jgi:hypothetical protein